mmetsp:Transcript_78522/g.163141  ORF Transcript_78522/g.163141 Transcript_78522/m.163141 type:complete len:220 (-) Transcript_78522:78-737(-)
MGRCSPFRHVSLFHVLVVNVLLAVAVGYEAREDDLDARLEPGSARDFTSERHSDGNNLVDLETSSLEEEQSAVSGSVAHFSRGSKRTAAVGTDVIKQAPRAGHPHKEEEDDGQTAAPGFATSSERVRLIGAYAARAGRAGMSAASYASSALIQLGGATTTAAIQIAGRHHQGGTWLLPDTLLLHSDWLKLIVGACVVFFVLAGVSFMGFIVTKLRHPNK